MIWKTCNYECASARRARVCTLLIFREKVANMSHRKAMAHIRQASWPLVLRFRLPLEERDVFSLSKIAEMRCAAGGKPTLRRGATPLVPIQRHVPLGTVVHVLATCKRLFCRRELCHTVVLGLSPLSPPYASAFLRLSCLSVRLEPSLEAQR